MSVPLITLNHSSRTDRFAARSGAARNPQGLALSRDTFAFKATSMMLHEIDATLSDK